MGYIYVIQNKINNKKYIGQSQQKDINSRWNSHKNLKHKTVGQILLNAYKKYGIDNFMYKIINKQRLIAIQQKSTIINYTNIYTVYTYYVI